MAGDARDTEELEPGTKAFSPQRVAASRGGMVSSQHHLATEAGARILGAGGNAIDAAVAAAFALGVCEPAASGLGGQTMMLVYLADENRTIALDGSSRAPNRAMLSTVDKPSLRLRGHRATTVPSTPAVLDYALRSYGALHARAVLEPAIQLAEDGFSVSQLQHDLTKRELRHLTAGTAAPFFLRDGRRPYPVGSHFRQPVLAGTLRTLAREGVQDFYLGSIAREIHADMEAHDGLLHLDDLAQVPQPIERKPLSCMFEGKRVLTFPPPGAGRTLVEMLNILEQFPIGRRGTETPEGAVLMAELIRQAFRDREDRPFDPAYYAQVSHKPMTSLPYAKQVAGRLHRRLRTQGETTHLSVMDNRGNVVALTQSIERVYGSYTVSPSLGFLFNNYMSAFDYEDISHPYYLRPNAVPWASVAPTIVFKDRRPWLAIGSPGSERITPSIVQVLLQLKTRTPFEAVASPRLHCNLNGKVSLEAARMRSDIPDALRRHGFTVDVRDPYSFYLGCVQLVLKERGGFVGVADPRRDGAAAGPP